MKISLKNDVFDRANTGSQPKWLINGIWYKQDDGRYEGLAEVIVSDVLKKSNVKDYASYDPEMIIYHGKEFSGCKSKHFLGKGQKLIETIHLLENHGMGDLVKDKWDALLDPEQTIQDFVHAVKAITSFSEFDKYLTMLLELDQVILNPDRHYGNICVLKDSDHYDYAPFFDQGRSFALSDSLWAKSDHVEEIISKVEARPFTLDFSRQTEILENRIQEKPLRLAYGKDDLRKTLDRCSEVYSDQILRRAETVFLYQMSRYPDYFLNEETRERLEKLSERVKKEIGLVPVRRESQLVLSCPIDPEITFFIKPSGEVALYQKEKPVDLDTLLFRHNSAYHFYRDLFYVVREEEKEDKKKER